MTLPTTRIDTLSPPGGHQDGDSTTNCSDSSQQILLVDFVPNGKGGGAVVGGSDGSSSSVEPRSHTFPGGHGATIPLSSNNVHLQQPMYPSSYQVPVQVQPMPVKQQNHVNYTNDLSNFTLVNLSNVNEREEEDLNDNPCQPMIPRRAQGRNSTSSSHKRENPYSSYPTKATTKSSSLSSSDDDNSDTRFLVPQRSHDGIKGRKEACHYRLQKQSSMTPLSPDSPILNGSTQQGHRKKLKRKRSTARKQFSRPQNTEGNDMFPMCCCFGEEETPNSRASQSGASSPLSKYLRFICVIVIIIFIATFTSIMVSLQRKVDSLSLEVNKLNSAAGSTNFPSRTPESDQDNHNSTSHPMQDIIAKQEQLNFSISTLEKQLDTLTQKVSNLEKQPSIDDLRKDLARLGSEMKGSIEEMKKEFDSLKTKAEEIQKFNSDKTAGTGDNSKAQDATAVPPTNNQR